MSKDGSKIIRIPAIPAHAIDKLLALVAPERPAPIQASGPADLFDDDESKSRALAAAFVATKNMEDSGDGSNRKKVVVERCYDDSLTADATTDVFRQYEAERPFSRHYDDANIIAELRRIEATGRERKPYKATYPHTDLGNAKRFAYEHRLNVRYVRERKKYVVWTGRNWVEDDSAVHRLAIKTVEGIFTDAMGMEDTLAREELLKHAMRSQRRAAIDAIPALAKSIEPIPTDTCAFNRQAWALPFRNGTIELRNGRLREHRREDLFTTFIPYDFPALDDTLKPERFLRFLDEIFAGDHDLIAYIRRLFGCALVGEVIEPIWSFFHGTGANGKSVLVNVVRESFGDYAVMLPDGFWEKQKYEQPSCLKMELYNRRLAVSNETSEGSKLDESLIKAMTSSEPISGHRKYENPIQFAPTHTPITLGNHPPFIPTNDEAMKRRISRVPFDVTIPPEKRDKFLLDKLRPEIPYIMRWMVEGCLEWQRIGLQPPAKVVASTKAYFDESDPVSQFVAERCKRGPTESIPAQRLYDAYRSYCQDVGQHPFSVRRFAPRIEQLGISRKAGNSCTKYLGINLIHPTTQDFEVLDQ